MAISPVNLGAAPNDGTGDALRVAFAKCNKAIAGYNLSTHLWADTDWQAAMADFVAATAPQLWKLSGGNLIYPATGSPKFTIGSTGIVTLSDSSTLGPDGSGHLLYSGLLGVGLAAWDKYPYEAAVVARNGDTKLGVYSLVSDLTPGAGASASLTFGAPNASNTDGYAPGFELQFIGDNLPSATYMRFNFLERDSSGNVDGPNTLADIFNIYGDGHVTMGYTLAVGGGITSPADIEVTSNTAGVILQSPSGIRYRLVVADDGTLSTVVA